MAEHIHALALQAYDRLIGPELDELSVDGCITKAPVWRRGCRALPGGPWQTGPEALGRL